MWDSIPPDARDPQCSSYLQRDLLIISYINWAFTKRWAWDGLNRLLVTLEDRREPIPEPLKEWSCSVVSRRARGTLKVPHKPNPKNKRFAPKDGRDLRIMRVFNVLCENGWSEEGGQGRDHGRASRSPGWADHPFGIPEDGDLHPVQTPTIGTQ